MYQGLDKNSLAFDLVIGDDTWNHYSIRQETLVNICPNELHGLKT